MDMEAMFDRLRHLTEQLEGGDLSLEQSLVVYTEATEMQLKIKAELARADRFEVKVISQDGTISDFGPVGERQGR